MNKSQLAELFSKKDYPLDEFVQMPAIATLEAEAEAIEAIEGFHLPEITRLICCSNILSQMPWAEKYVHVCSFYKNEPQFDATAFLSEYPDSKAFDALVLALADSRLLSALMRVFDQLKEEKKRLVADQKKINKHLSQLKDLNLSHDEYDAAKAECERKLEEVEKRIAHIDSFIKTWKTHRTLIKKAIDKNTNDAVELRREQAYEILFPSVATEEVFLKNFIREGILSDEMRSQLRSEIFCESVLRYMDHGSYQEVALPVIMRLYEQGAIDLEAPFMAEYFHSHASLVSDYLCSKMYELFENKDSDDRALLDVAIRIESTYCMDASAALFNTLWNTIQESDLWLTILRYASELDLPDIHDAIYGFMKGLDDAASEALVEALFMPLAQEMHITATEVIGSALRNRADISPIVVISAFQKMEQLFRSAQRKLRTADRKINGQGQMLFSSVYESVEHLEIIASNLRMSKGNIPCQLVANELVDIVTSLRAGMQQMNLLPVCNVEDWKRGYPIAFDVAQHRMPMNTENVPEKIMLQTMGFRYLGDDGEWQQYNARVVPKPMRITSKQPVENNQSISSPEHAANHSKKKV